MGRTIVVCCDGTGNTFDKRVTNVTELIRLLDLDDESRQVAVYAQGVGTNGAVRERIPTGPPCGWCRRPTNTTPRCARPSPARAACSSGTACGTPSAASTASWPIFTAGRTTAWC